MYTPGYTAASFCTGRKERKYYMCVCIVWQQESTLYRQELWRGRIQELILLLERMSWTSDIELEFQIYKPFWETVPGDFVQIISALQKSSNFCCTFVWEKKILYQIPSQKSKKSSQFDSGPEGFCKRHDCSILLGEICRDRGLQRPSCFCKSLFHL